MKNITDIYEASLSSNKLDESLLDDIDDTIEFGDKYADIYNFINWWMESSSDVYNGSAFDPKYDKKDIVKRLLNVVSYKNGEFNIDIKVANRDDELFDIFDYTTIYLSKKIGIPSFIKTINFINVGNNSYMDLCSQINDMSKLKITCTGKEKAGLNVTIQTNVTGKIILPVINTTLTLIVARTVESITFPKGTNIENLELSYCLKVTEINGELKGVTNFSIPKHFAKELVKTSLGLNPNTKIII